jgi:hypothetical protein
MFYILIVLIGSDTVLFLGFIFVCVWRFGGEKEVQAVFSS